MKMNFFTLLALATYLLFILCSSQAYPRSTSCRRPCPRIRDPICAHSLAYKSPRRKRRFQNRCLFDNANRCQIPGSPYRIVKCRSTTTRTARPHPPPSCPSCAVIRCISGTTCRAGKNGCGLCTPIASSIRLLKPKDCPLACNLIFAPVCAKSVTGELKTFSNKCFLNVANTCKEPGSPFTFIGNDVCPESTPTPSPTCSRICSRLLDPICAKSTVTGELRTFENKCLFNAANNCKDPGSPFKFVCRTGKGGCEECAKVKATS